MTNCLFAHGITAVTAELTARYHAPVATHLPLVVRGWIERSAHGCHVLGADLCQDGHVAATARAKFLSIPKRALRTENGGTRLPERSRSPARPCSGCGGASKGWKLDHFTPEAP